MAKISFEGLKDVYYAGEDVEGAIILTEGKGLEARSIVIELYYQIIVISSGQRRYGYTKRVDIYKEEIDRDVKFTTDSTRYEFKIHIPEDAPPSIAYEISRRVDWVLRVKLDIPFHRDIVKDIILKVYNSVKPTQSIIENITVENQYARLVIDKNVFEHNETVTGKFIIFNMPSRTKKIRICLYTRLEIKVEEAILTDILASEYEITCVEYDSHKLSINREYTFKLDRNAIWSATYINPDIRTIVYVILKFDIKYAPDIILKAPITIYHEKRRISIKKVSVEETIAETLTEEIMKIMRDGRIRDVVDIRLELGFKYDVDEIIKACNKLVEEGKLEIIEAGELLRKYRIKDIKMVN